jgi:hypothetical protein
VGEELGQQAGHVGARFLDDVDRVAAVAVQVLGALRLEAGGDQLFQGPPPLVAVALGEEVAGLLLLHIEQRGQVGGLRRGRPGERDRAPDAEVVAQMGIVDRHHPVDLGEHAQ